MDQIDKGADHVLGEGRDSLCQVQSFRCRFSHTVDHDENSLSAYKEY